MFGGQYYPNRLTRDLIQHTEEMKTLGVMFRSDAVMGIA